MSPLKALLGKFVTIESDEEYGGLLLGTAYGFLIMFSYYILRAVRDLMSAGGGYILAPAQSVHGIKHINTEKQAVLEAWSAFGRPVAPLLSCWVNVDIPTRTCVLHAELCEEVARVRRTGLKGVDELLRDGGWLQFGGRDGARDFTARLLEGRGRYEVKDCLKCSRPSTPERVTDRTDR